MTAAEDICVYLTGEEMIDYQAWNNAMQKNGFSLAMNAFDAEKWSGMLTCQWEGTSCQFEYYYEEVEEDDDLDFEIIGDRDFVMTFIPPNDGKDLTAAIIAAGVLANRIDGVIYDCNSRKYVDSVEAIGWIQDCLAS